jgi:predicted membrane protein
MQFCPERYMTGSSTGCYPVGFVVETVVYFGLVALLWYAVALEAAGKGRSILTPKTGMRAAADCLAIVFGASVLVFGVLYSSRFGSRIDSFLVGITYLVWAVAIIVFYGHDLRVHRSGRADQSASR